jgi:hypothetical protein
MRSFTDNAGRTWQISVTVATIKRVRGMTGVDLMGVVNPESGLFDKLADPVTLVDLLWAVVQPAPEGVTDEDFGNAMGGDALESATKALLDEMVDFFPKGRRTILRNLLDKTEDFSAATLAKAALEVEKLDLGSLLGQARYGSSSINTPASSESTLPILPSGKSP